MSPRTSSSEASDRFAPLDDLARAGANGVGRVRLPVATSRVETYGKSLREFLGDDEPEGDDASDFLVEGLLPASSPCAIAGPPKSAKTMMAVLLAVCVGLGRKFLGRFDCKQGRVLLLLHEDPERVTRRRVWRLCRGVGVDPRDLDEDLVIDTSTPFSFDEGEDLVRLHRTIEQVQPTLVVLDSLSRMHRCDENSKAEMGRALTAWADLSRMHGITACVIHHFTKSSNPDASPGHRMRGTGDLFALVRGVVGVERNVRSGISKVTTDGNLPGMAEPFGFRIEDGEDERGKKTIRLDFCDGDDAEHSAMDQRILAALVAGPLGASELRRAVGGKGKTIDDRAHRLQARGLLDRDLSKRWRLAPRPEVQSS